MQDNVREGPMHEESEAEIPAKINEITDAPRLNVVPPV